MPRSFPPFTWTTGGRRLTGSAGAAAFGAGCCGFSCPSAASGFNAMPRGRAADQGGPLPQQRPAVDGTQ